MIHRREITAALQPELAHQPDQAVAINAAPAQADPLLDAGAAAASEPSQRRQSRSELATPLDAAGATVFPEGRNLVIGDDGKPYPIVLWPSDGGGQYVD